MTRFSMIPLAMLPTAALAHSGDHSHVAPTHALTEADHVAVILAVIVAGALVWALRRGRS